MELRRLVRGLLPLAGLALLALSPVLGQVQIPAAAVESILLHQLSAGALAPDPCGPSVSAVRCAGWIAIVWDTRIPEILLAALVGAALGMSGATLQGAFRNPLADPYLLGLSSGATLGTALVFVYGIGSAAANIALPLLAFLGAISTGLLILVVARLLGGSTETLLLMGVTLSFLLSAILSIVLLFNPEGSLQVDFWLLGGLGGASWGRDGLVLGGVVVAGALLLLYGRDLNLLQLGPEVATSLGLDARRVRQRLILLASVATAMAVAFAGIIGFVGLISPHVVRRVARADYRVVLPGSAAVGALFLLVARDLSVGIPSTGELPVGIFTAVGGAPVFLYLLYRRRHTSGEGNA